MNLDVTIITQVKVIYEGKAGRVIVPGDAGVFEVLPFHKRILSRLLKGRIDVDGKSFPILRGVIKVDRNHLVAVVEEEY
jgi:F0F1-type ATP synthase epsilon subunit